MDAVTADFAPVAQVRMRKVRHLHFVGIGGAGMSGIAEVLHTLGFVVSGSDMNESPAVRHLRELGIEVFIGHAAENLAGADVLVVSTAISADNPELVAANERRMPVVRRAEMLAEIMRFRIGLAVAGTHGKTTTTSLLAAIMAEAGLDPTYVIGGKLLSSASNARLGRGEYLIAEADESDASFLHLQPHVAVVTNIDADHLETYDNDFSRLLDHFVEFLHNLPFYGLAVLCADDDHAMSIVERVGRQVLTYGIDAPADVRATDIHSDGFESSFNVSLPGGESWHCRLAMPGRHNILNALAAITVAHDLGVEGEAIVRALANFKGVGRRLERRGTLAFPNGRRMLLDDYGHHPREVAATLAAVRDAWPDEPLLLIFQPHRYTRTRDLFEDFVEVLSQVDQLILMEVYAAGQQPIAGADGRSLARAIRARGQVDPVFVAEPAQVAEVIDDMVREDGIVLTLGAGNVGSLPGLLLERWGDRS
ncbi:UDP-N-acetylmuramate--L-alanine ligase [Guyparkeria hydrothermalis]|uniref:UDP-N-acetylmuramate--L-alanine ligase n=1 Tax=Guyparkeria TaxID=2035712 RepID=UPI001FFC8A08|nr:MULTISPECIES: UDP-N-acetylmuramate--L-alanine ligase [Guyparkeria]MCL7750462.1 UDP-N-acetylmuramate--L-alanine ligase [Guyparkeria hydrothermalis]